MKRTLESTCPTCKVKATLRYTPTHDRQITFTGKCPECRTRIVLAVSNNKL